MNRDPFGAGSLTGRGAAQSTRHGQLRQTERCVPQFIIDFRVPGRSAKSDEPFLEPVRQIQQKGILNDFLQTGSEQDGIHVHICYALPYLLTQIQVVTVEIDKHFRSHDLGPAGLTGKCFFESDITLLEIGDVNVNNDFNLIA